jgi:hypothetical protein
MPNVSKLAFFKKWSLTIRIMPLVASIILLKYAIYRLQLDFLTANPLLPSLVAAAVFLMGFLISGVLSDYKESEKLPGELSASLETIADEAEIIYKNKKAAVALDFLTHLHEFAGLLIKWLYQQEHTSTVIEKIREFNDYYLAFEPLAQATFIGRMKQEQHNMRKIIFRIRTIRDTSFIPSGYAIAEGIAALLLVALLFTKLDPFYESMFFAVPITYLFIYMLALIGDLDNPFEYNTKGETSGEVSLKELHDVEQRLNERFLKLGAEQNTIQN